MAARKAAMSPGELAQKPVTEVYTDVERKRIRHCLVGLEKEVRGMRGGLANAVEAFLVASRPVTKEQAKNWRKTYLEF